MEKKGDGKAPLRGAKELASKVMELMREELKSKVMELKSDAVRGT